MLAAKEKLTKSKTHTHTHTLGTGRRPTLTAAPPIRVAALLDLLLATPVPSHPSIPTFKTFDQVLN